MTDNANLLDIYKVGQLRRFFCRMVKASADCPSKCSYARRVATRYDKTAESFLGFIDITSIRLWLRLLST